LAHPPGGRLAPAYAYAILNLNGPDARVSYYQVQITLENGQLGVEESVVYQEG
jgi:hypothetical protein